MTFCGQYTLIFLSNCWNIQFCNINTILLYQRNVIPISMSVDTCLWPNVHSFCPPSLLKKFYVEKYFGPPADLRHTLLSMYQKLLRNIWEFFLFEEVLSGLLLQEIKNGITNVFCPSPRRTQKLRFLFSTCFEQTFSIFISFIFFSPKPQRRGPLEVLFDVMMGRFFPKLGFFRSYTK